MWNAQSTPADWAPGRAEERVANPFLEQRWQAAQAPQPNTNPAWSTAPAPGGADPWGLRGQLLPLDRPVPFLRFSQQAPPAQRSAQYATQTATLGEPLRDPSKFGC